MCCHCFTEYLRVKKTEYTLFAIRRGGERGEKKKKREELVAAIYEEPVYSVETAIPAFCL